MPHTSLSDECGISEEKSREIHLNLCMSIRGVGDIFEVSGRLIAVASSYNGHERDYAFAMAGTIRDQIKAVDQPFEFSKVARSMAALSGAVIR